MLPLNTHSVDIPVDTVATIHMIMKANLITLCLVKYVSGQVCYGTIKPAVAWTCLAHVHVHKMLKSMTTQSVNAGTRI